MVKTVSYFVHLPCFSNLMSDSLYAVMTDIQRFEPSSSTSPLFLFVHMVLESAHLAKEDASCSIVFIFFLSIIWPNANRAWWIWFLGILMWPSMLYWKYFSLSPVFLNITNSVLTFVIEVSCKSGGFIVLAWQNQTPLGSLLIVLLRWRSRTKLPAA